MVGCVYIARNTVNGKAYVGKTERGLEQRRVEHENDAARGSSLAFHCALRKHGPAAFEWAVLFESKNEAILFQMEAHFIGLEDSRTRGYNCTAGGEGTSGLKWRPESRAKLSASKTGTKASEAARETMRRNRKGRRMSEEAKKNLSKALTGVKKSPRSETHKKNHAAAVRGFRHKEETKLKVSLLLRGRSKPPGFGDAVGDSLRAYFASQPCSECGNPISEVTEGCRRCKKRHRRRQRPRRKET